VSTQSSLKVARVSGLCRDMESPSNLTHRIGPFLLIFDLLQHAPKADHGREKFPIGEEIE
jgi:hypothetical protein